MVSRKLWQFLEMELLEVGVVVVAQFDEGIGLFEDEPVVVQLIEGLEAGDVDDELLARGVDGPGALPGFGKADGAEDAVILELKDPAVEFVGFVLVFVPEIGDVSPIPLDEHLGKVIGVEIVVGFTTPADDQKRQYQPDNPKLLHHGCSKFKLKRLKKGLPKRVFRKPLV